MLGLSAKRADAFTQLHGGNIREAAASLQLEPGGLVDFSVNTNPYGPPPEILAATIEAAGSVGDYPELHAESFIAALAEEQEIDPACIIAGNGSAELLYWLFAWLKARRVLIFEPAFGDYCRAAKANRLQIHSLPLKESGGFAVDWPGFKRALDHVDMAVIGRPNNPTGGVIAGGRLGELARRHPGVIFLLDEAFIDFVEPPLSLCRQATALGNMIVLRSLTKIFSVPGVRLGYLVANRQLAANLNLARPPWPLGAAQIAAGKAALQLGDFARDSRRRLAKERRLLLAALADMDDVTAYDSAANFILIKINRTGTTGTDLTISLAQKGVYVRDCRSFAGLGHNYIRIAVKTRQANSRLIAALKEAL